MWDRPLQVPWFGKYSSNFYICGVKNPKISSYQSFLGCMYKIQWWLVAAHMHMIGSSSDLASRNVCLLNLLFVMMKMKIHLIQAPARHKFCVCHCS